MVRFVDPDAGFATFTRGRSLCVRLQGTVDARTARAVERHLLHHRDAVRLRFECSSVRDIDPAAARILVNAARGWRGRGEGRGVELHNRPRPAASAPETRPIQVQSGAGSAASAPDRRRDAAELRRDLRKTVGRTRTRRTRTRFQNSTVSGPSGGFGKTYLPSRPYSRTE